MWYECRALKVQIYADGWWHLVRDRSGGNRMYHRKKWANFLLSKSYGHSSAHQLQKEPAGWQQARAGL
jgi:hypothetical protein